MNVHPFVNGSAKIDTFWFAPNICQKKIENNANACAVAPCNPSGSRLSADGQGLVFETISFIDANAFSCYFTLAAAMVLLGIGRLILNLLPLFLMELQLMLPFIFSTNSLQSSKPKPTPRSALVPELITLSGVKSFCLCLSSMPTPLSSTSRAM